MQITWSVENMDRRTDDGFVCCVHWRATAQDGDYSASVYGTVGLEGDHPAIPFASLTKEEVLAWVFDKLDKDATEENLANQIDALKNPTQESGLPW